MKVFVATWGSQGDFQPYLALARAFALAGHDVKLGAPPSAGYAELAAEQNVAFVPLGPALDDLAELEARKWRKWPIPISEQAKLARLTIDRLMWPYARESYERCLEVASWADVVVYHFLQQAGRMAAEKLARPFVSGRLDPGLLPTRPYPPMSVSNFRPWLNPLLREIAYAFVFKMNAIWLGPINALRRGFGLAPVWSLAKDARLINAIWTGPINALRREVGLPPVRSAIGEAFLSPGLNLIAASPRVTPPPRDWPSRYRLTGHWLLDHPPDWAPSPDLADFLSRDPKPIVITFGSPLDAEAHRLTQLLVEAVGQAKARAVIQPGGAKLGSGLLPPTMLRLDRVPHSWLLPQVAAVVHHGGAGTTAAAFRAGVPSVIVPDLGDQPFWAQRALELGVAPPPIPRAELTAARLAEAIVAATTDPSLRSRAAALGEALRQEDGAATAVRLVERYVEGGLSALDF